MNSVKNPYYIYNLEQANWMLQQGCLPIQAGVGLKGDLYLKFARTSQIEEMVNTWKLRQRSD